MYYHGCAVWIFTFNFQSPQIFASAQEIIYSPLSLFQIQCPTHINTKFELITYYTLAL